MRGVFNDFASEVNRSIGFYSSVNRQAKISKVIGLGNGFKLPGLQKFLQQNLSNEVEKLDGFARMVGEEVIGQPVFQDNLASFAVAYGLALQGLGKGALKTNLLPPEIEQVRLIRAKKPWALAASALLMLGFSALFLGEYRVLAKVITPKFQSAVAEATTVAKRGAEYKSKFEAAKGEWNAKNEEGKSLVGNAADRGMWPDFLKTINSYLPDPVRDYKLDPQDPLNAPALDRLRVHIDAIKPVWREDVAGGWFNLAAPEGPSDLAKSLMHPYDRENPPKAEGGWVVQIIGHHYNPYASAEQVKLPELLPNGKINPARIEFGPYGYLIKRIIPSLLDPQLRLYGVSHVALAWMISDKEWTTEKGAQTNNLASNTVPILSRAAPPASADAGGGGGPGDMMSMMGGMPRGGGMMGGSSGGMMGSSGGMMGGMMGSSGGMMIGGKGMMGRGGVMGGMMGSGQDEMSKKLSYLTRTDFLIQFVWQPPKPDDRPKDAEERKAKLEELVKLLREKEKNKSEVAIKETDIEKESIKNSQVIDAELQKAQQKAAAAVAKAQGGGDAAATPANPPASGAPAAPAAPPK
jgi:type IV pilus assembly protein PilM